MSVERLFRRRRDVWRAWRLNDVPSSRNVSRWREPCSVRWIPSTILKSGWHPRSGISRNTAKLEP